MAPTLMPGDWALTVPARSPRRGWVVVAEHPQRPGFEVVKRIAAAPGESVTGTMLGVRQWWLEGDRPDSSTDSRSFGPVGPEQILGRVLLVYWPPDRRHLV
jgi:nickel-type superoxide dismutase maturation protease